MKDIHLKDWLSRPEVTQALAAELMGCTQGAISQMLSSNREIYITLDRGRAVSFFEKKKPGRKSVA